MQIHVSLDPVVEIARNQKRVARDSDKGIKYQRWGETWHEERSLDIDVGRVDHTLLNRNICVKSVGDTSSLGSLPQVTSDLATPSLESKMRI